VPADLGETRQSPPHVVANILRSQASDRRTVFSITIRIIGAMLPIKLSPKLPAKLQEMFIATIRRINFSSEISGSARRSHRRA
jgi:hypothetical protein